MVILFIICAVFFGIVGLLLMQKKAPEVICKLAELIFRFPCKYVPSLDKVVKLVFCSNVTRVAMIFMGIIYLLMSLFMIILSLIVNGEC